MTVPLDGIPLPEHRAIVEGLDQLGYADVWSAEVAGPDAFTPLALAAAWSPTLRLGTAIVPVSTRGPAVLAMSAAAMAEAAPGRFALGIGASSQVIVERWSAVPFDEPYRRTRDTLRFLRRTLVRGLDRIIKLSNIGGKHTFVSKDEIDRHHLSGSREVPARATRSSNAARPALLSLAERVFWVVDNGSSHRGQASIKRLEAAYKNLRLVHLPVHACWLTAAAGRAPPAGQSRVAPGRGRQRRV